MHKTNNKIAIISSSLGNGGAERFAGVLSFILSDLEYEIHHIIVNNRADYEFTGTLYNLGQLCENETTIIKKIKKGFLLNRYLKKNSIAIIIDNRTRNHLLRDCITKWIYGDRRVFFIIHSSKIKDYLPTNKLLAKFLYCKAAQLVCVAKEIETEVIKKYNFKNTTLIYNPIKISLQETSQNDKIPEKFILFFGRIEEKVKNFTLMLTSFKDSKIYEKGYKLVIMGNGADCGFVKSLIDVMGLKQFVEKVPYQKNPFEYVQKARYTILTSYYEGFPMSIIESLVLGTPVISVDCNSGPNEIIIDEQNGLLVENHNALKLAQAMSRLVIEQDLYNHCKNNATNSVAHLSYENIAKQWQKILFKN